MMNGRAVERRNVARNLLLDALEWMHGIGRLCESCRSEAMTRPWQAESPSGQQKGEPGGVKKRRTKPNRCGCKPLCCKELPVTHLHAPIAKEANFPASRTEFVGNSVRYVRRVAQQCGSCEVLQRFGVHCGADVWRDWHREVPKRGTKAHNRSQIDAPTNEMLVTI